MTESILARILNLDFTPCLKYEGDEILLELCEEALKELKQDSHGQVLITFRGIAHHLNVSERELKDFMLEGWYEFKDDEDMEFWAGFYEDCGVSDILMEAYPVHCSREMLPIEWLDMFCFHFQTQKAEDIKTAIEIDKENFEFKWLTEMFANKNATSELIKQGGKSHEKTVSDKLAKKERGKREVYCKHGRVDVVTSTHVIEVKTGRNWKSALGQLAAYQSCFPNLQKRLHLFDYYHCNLEEIREICSSQDIVVTLES